jgi:hypothetical protein
MCSDLKHQRFYIGNGIKVGLRFTETFMCYIKAFYT